MSEYTPTTEQVREAYATRNAPVWDTERRATFDRWLAAHDADTREEIAHEIEALMVGPAVSITDPLPWDWKRAGRLDMQKLAARIARGEGSE